MFDYSDAIATTLVYLTTIGGGVGFVIGLPKFLGGMWATVEKIGTEIRKGNFQAAFSAAGDLGGAVGKVHGHSATAHKASK